MKQPKPIEATATCGSFHFAGYAFGQDAPFNYQGGVGDADGNVIHGTIHITRYFAIQDALHVLKCAAAFDGGLTEEERGKLRELADAQPCEGRRDPFY